MENCLFCKIVNKEIQTSFVAENVELVAFDDIRPKAPAHVLILPKAHVLSVKEADEKLSGKLITLAKKIAEEKGLEGYKLIFNVGRKGGQVIEHLHLHLVGGWNEAPKKVEI